MQALVLVAMAVASLYALQILLAAGGLAGLPAVVVAYVAVGVALVAYARRRGGLAVVGLAPARVRHVIAGALIGLATWYVGLRIVEWLHPPGDMGPVDKVLEHTSLPPSILAIALLPAIVEELVFRGILARGLASRLPVAAAVAISAVLFSAFHLIPRQMVAVFPLGLALGYVAIRARSALPTMVAHLANNAIVILATRGDLDALDRVPANGLLALALVVVATGLALAATGAA
ncbi:MAG: lysostaphin resistance A-like protein [Acidobacteriota bacterium]